MNALSQSNYATGVSRPVFFLEPGPETHACRYSASETCSTVLRMSTEKMYMMMMIIVPCYCFYYYYYENGYDYEH